MDQNFTCLKLVIGFWEPYLLPLDINPPYKVEGVAKDIIEIIMEKLNFCYTLVMSNVEDFGFQLPNGTWTGSLGLLSRSEVDMSMVLFMMSESRSSAADYSEPVFMEEQSIGFPRPKFEPDIKGIVKPFTLRMWVAIILILPVISVLVVYFEKGYNYALSSIRYKEITRNDKGIAEPSIWSLCVLLMQSFPWEPKGTSVRILSGIWLLAAFIIANVYRSNLVAMLIAPVIRLPFDSFEEMSRTNYKVFLAQGSRIYDAVQNAEPGSALWRARKNFITDMTYMEATRGYLNEKFGAVSTRKTLEYAHHLAFSAKGYCGLYLISSSNNIFKGTPVAFAFPKKSELKAKVDPIIRNLKEFGITEYLMKKKMPNATQCLKPIASGVTNKRPLELKDLYGAFSVLLAGTVFSTIAFILELIMNKQRNQPKEADFVIAFGTSNG